jgi:integrase
MASLQARHQIRCKIVEARPVKLRDDGTPAPPNRWSTFDDATKKAGCTCRPDYVLIYRQEGKIVREGVGRDRQTAERELKALEGDVAKGNVLRVKDIRFDEWADEWLASFRGKETTRVAYGFTLAYAKRAFGQRKVRELQPSNVDRFLALIREANHRPKTDKDPGREASEATLAKHLRQLGACLQAAVPEYATDNPVRLLHKSKRPKVRPSDVHYFTDDELARLWPALAALERPVIVALCKTAVATGARFGELAALRWDDVNLLDRSVRIARTYTAKVGETTPKSGEARTIDLTPPAAAVLEAWFRDSGGQGLVFASDLAPGHLDDAAVLRQALYPAMTAADIPRMGAHGGRKRTFHSFRHTFARLALEGGAEITWVKEQLGHSSITLTVDLYGRWSSAARKAQAEKLAEAFKL